MDSSGSHIDSVWTCPFIVGGRLGSRESFDRRLEWIRIGISLLMVWVLREHLAALVIQRLRLRHSRFIGRRTIFQCSCISFVFRNHILEHCRPCVRHYVAKASQDSDHANRNTPCSAAAILSLSTSNTRRVRRSCALLVGRLRTIATMMEPLDRLVRIVRAPFPSWPSKLHC